MKEENESPVTAMMVSVGERIRDALADNNTVSPYEAANGLGWEACRHGISLRWFSTVDPDDLIPTLTVEVGQERNEIGFVSVDYMNDLEVGSLFWSLSGMDSGDLDEEGSAVLDRLPELKAWDLDLRETKHDEEAFGWIDSMIRSFLRYETPNR